MIDRDAFKRVQEKYSAELLQIEAATRDYFGGNVSPFTVRRWIAKGVGVPPLKLKAIRLGRRYFLRPEDIAEFLAAQENPGLYARKTREDRVTRAVKKLAKRGA